MASSGLQAAALFFSTLLLLLLILPHASTAATATTTLENECERYAAGDKGSNDYCLWKLRCDNGSTTADARGLAAIAARMARATAKATRERIIAGMTMILPANETAAAPTAAARRDCLAACAAEYASAVRRLGHAARDAGGGGGGIQRAQTLLAVVVGTPARCDATFAAAGQRSPLDGADFGLDDEVELAIALLPSPPITD